MNKRGYDFDSKAGRQAFEASQVKIEVVNSGDRGYYGDRPGQQWQEVRVSKENPYLSTTVGKFEEVDSEIFQGDPALSRDEQYEQISEDKNRWLTRKGYNYGK